MNRRQLLRALQRVSALGAVPSGLMLPASLMAADKKPEEEEEKKKSTLVSDVERFGRGKMDVALLLPDIEGPFRFAADAVLRGFQTAHAVDGEGVSVHVIRIEKDDFRDAGSVYSQLSKRRFNLVVGPLTRSSVNELSRLGELPVPTLALNLPDQDATVPLNCVLYSLAIEFEGRSAARFAFAEALQSTGNFRAPRALVLSDPSALSKRASDAFMDGWQSFGGELEEPIIERFSTASALGNLLLDVRADVVFAAMDPAVLREVRQAFAPGMPIYGTSQLNVGAIVAQENLALLAAPELDGVRVVEMPWQLMPSHPAVMAYERSGRLPHMEMQRLYAFGIDAFRLARLLLDQTTQIELDGVTGKLTLDTFTDPRVLREPILGQYRQGILMPAYETPYAQLPGDGQKPNADQDADSAAGPAPAPAPARVRTR